MSGKRGGGGFIDDEREAEVHPCSLRVTSAIEIKIQLAGRHQREKKI